jgi:uncharacterized repeat protein (TIGR02543 family)
VLEKLLVAVSGAGKVTSSGVIACGGSDAKCQGLFKPGTSVKLSAGALAGFQFTGWTGGCTGHAAICVISIKKDSNVTAMFKPLHASSIVPIAIDDAAFLVNWDKSVGSGKLALGGTIGKPSVVEIELHRSGGTKPLLKESLSLPKGKFSLSLKLDPGALGDGQPLLPGGFVVSLGGHSGSLVVPTQLKTVSLPPPPTGVVLRAFASASAHSGPTGSVHASGRQVFAHFMFQSVPGQGKPISIAWYEPGGRLLGVAPKPTALEVDSSIVSKAPLPKGTWRVDLRAGNTVVKSVTVEIT